MASGSDRAAGLAITAASIAGDDLDLRMAAPAKPRSSRPLDPAGASLSDVVRDRRQSFHSDDFGASPNRQHQLSTRDRSGWRVRRRTTREQSVIANPKLQGSAKAAAGRPPRANPSWWTRCSQPRRPARPTARCLRQNVQRKILAPQSSASQKKRRTQTRSRRALLFRARQVLHLSDIAAVDPRRLHAACRTGRGIRSRRNNDRQLVCGIEDGFNGETGRDKRRNLEFS